MGKAPTLNGEMTQAEWPGKIQRLDRDPSRQSACGDPVLVKFSYDDRCLYVAASVTMFEAGEDQPRVSVGEGRRSGNLIAGKTPGGEPATFVIRGYANGTWQRAAVAGATAKVTERLGGEVRFSAKTLRGRGGREEDGGCQWAIPFVALGLRPAAGLKVPFNMDAFCAELGNGIAGKGRSPRTGVWIRLALSNSNSIDHSLCRGAVI